MTRLAVTADLHISDRGHRIDPATGLNGRFADALEVTRWIAEDATRRACDALIVAGDITEERHPSPWRVAMIREALALFDGPVILVRGNHDGERNGRSAIDVLAAGLTPDHGFTGPGVAWVGRTAVCALPYLDRHWLRAQDGFEDVADADVFRVLGEQFLTIARGLYVQAHEEQAEDTVLVVHQGLSGGHMSEEQQAFLGDMSLVVDTGALAAIGFDAIVAGHFHKRQVLREDPLVAYVGSPHRVSFGEERDPKSYMVLDTAGAYELIETPCRRFVTVDYAAETVDMASWEGAVARAINVEPGVPVEDVVTGLLQAGAVEVTEVRHQRVEAPAVEAGRLNETQSAEEALETYFEDDADREALLDRGRAVLAEVA